MSIKQLIGKLLLFPFISAYTVCVFICFFIVAVLGTPLFVLMNMAMDESISELGSFYKLLLCDIPLVAFNMVYNS